MLSLFSLDQKRSRDSNNHYYNHVRGLFKRSVLTICFRNNTTVTLQYRTDNTFKFSYLYLAHQTVADLEVVRWAQTNHPSRFRIYCIAPAVVINSSARPGGRY